MTGYIQVTQAVPKKTIHINVNQIVLLNEDVKDTTKTIIYLLDGYNRTVTEDAQTVLSLIQAAM